MMKRSLVLAALVAGCTGTYYPYNSTMPASQAQVQTTEVQSSESGTTVVQTSTSASYQPYQQPAPAYQPAYQPTYQPAAQPQLGLDPRCSAHDGPTLCETLLAFVEIQEVLASVQEMSCRQAARALDAYADRNPDQLAAIDAAEHEPKRAQDAFFARHQSTIQGTMQLAVELDMRCEGGRMDRALRRLRFHGLIGSGY